MSTSPVIRRLAVADLADYKRLREEVLAAHPDAFTSDASEARARTPESYRSRLGLEKPEGGEFTLGAWIESALVGAISLERDARIKVRHIGHIVGMMVASGRQGNGIGRAILDACIAEARTATGLEMLTLSVTESNENAVRLYEKTGFVGYGRLPNAIRVEGCYFTKLQMMLTL